jgi:lipopolysaccharide export system permease protein
MTFCAWIVQSSKYLAMLNQNNISLARFFHFSSYLSVDIVAVILPISLAISIGFVFQRFIESSQLTALQSAGISPVDLLPPLMSLVSIATCYLYVSNAYISPRAWTRFREIEFGIRNNVDPPEIPGTIFSKNGFSVYAQEYIGNFFFKNIFIVDSKNSSKSYAYFAKTGTIKNNMLILTDGERIEINDESNRNSITNFKLYQYNLNEILDNVKKAAQPNEKFMHVLLLENTGDKALDMAQKALFHQKITSPLLAIIFSLMAVLVILMAPYRRKKTYLRMIALIATIVVFQGTYFWITNASAKDLVFVTLNYVFVFASLFILVALICIRNRHL